MPACEARLGQPETSKAQADNEFSRCWTGGPARPGSPWSACWERRRTGAAAAATTARASRRPFPVRCRPRNYGECPPCALSLFRRTPRRPRPAPLPAARRRGGGGGVGGVGAGGDEAKEPWVLVCAAEGGQHTPAVARTLVSARLRDARGRRRSPQRGNDDEERERDGEVPAATMSRGHGSLSVRRRKGNAQRRPEP